MKISVIVPVYNVEKYLKRCLDSIVDQTYKNLEIIIVNDQTKDNSEEIINTYLSDNRIVYIKNIENVGLSESRNNALKIATGEYILFVDSDDEIIPNTVETLVRELSENKYDFMLFNTSIIGEDDEMLKEVHIEYNPELTDRENMILGPQYSWSRIYKANLFNEVKFPKGLIYEDLATMPKITFHSDNFKLLNVPFYRYRSREGSITKSPNHKPYDVYKVYDELINFDLNKFGYVTEEIRIQLYINILIKLFSLRHISGLKTRLGHLKTIKQYQRKYLKGITKNKYYKNYIKYFTSKKYRIPIYLTRLPLVKQMYVIIALGKKGY